MPHSWSRSCSVLSCHTARMHSTPLGNIAMNCCLLGQLSCVADFLLVHITQDAASIMSSSNRGLPDNNFTAHCLFLPGFCLCCFSYLASLHPFQSVFVCLRAVPCKAHCLSSEKSAFRPAKERHVPADGGCRQVAEMFLSCLGCIQLRWNAPPYLTLMPCSTTSRMLHVSDRPKLHSI